MEPTEAEPEALDYFSKLTTDWSRPHLNSKVLSQISQILGQIAKLNKRTRRSTLLQSPSGGQSDGILNMDIQQLSRIIKILERSILLGEDIDPFSGPVVKTHSATDGQGDDSGKSPAKGKKGSRAKSPEGRKSRSKSRTPGDTEVNDEESTDIDPNKIEHGLWVAKESILAADACFALLTADHLPKQVR
jgi:cohesin loading factor subunit SCC2